MQPMRRSHIQDYENLRAALFEYERHRELIDIRLREHLDRAAASRPTPTMPRAAPRAAPAGCSPTSWRITT